GARRFMSPAGDPSRTISRSLSSTSRRSSSTPATTRCTEVVPMSMAASVAPAPYTLADAGPECVGAAPPNLVAMAKPAQRRAQGRGRVTPKARPARTDTPTPSGRYTPPIPREQRSSPAWVPVTMFSLLVLGLVVIFLNYLDVLPGGMSNAYLGV